MKKYIALLIATTLSINTTNIVFANNLLTNLDRSAAAVELPLLTIEEATRRAISNSLALRAMQDNIILSEESSQRVRDQMFRPMVDVTQVIAWQANLMRAEAARAASLNNIDAQRDTLEFIVHRHFANIVMAENEIILFESSLNLARRDIDIMRVKLELGMVSAAEYNIANLNYEALLNERTALQNALLDAHRELNRLIGLPEDRVHRIEYTVDFEPLPSAFNLVGHISHSVANNVHVVNARGQSATARFEYENHRSQVDMITGMVIPGGPTRTEREIAYTQASRDAREARDRVENMVNDMYNQINSLELSINTLHIQLRLAYAELSLRSALFEAGQITRTELDRLEHNMITLEENIRRLEVNHSLVVMQFLNPNIGVGF